MDYRKEYKMWQDFYTEETITDGKSAAAYTYAYDNISNRILTTKSVDGEYVYNDDRFTYKFKTTK